MGLQTGEHTNGLLLEEVPNLSSDVVRLSCPKNTVYKS